MPKKRRNGGKDRCGRGHVGWVRCSNCGRCVPKDKAVKKYQVRNMVEAAAHGDLAAASVYPSGTYTLPKVYIKQQYCISCAVHARYVRSRSKEKRRVRAPAARARPGQKLPGTGKPQKGVKRSQRRLPEVARVAAMRR